MIERDRADRVETAQVVTIRSVVPMPRDDVQRRMIGLASPKVSAEFCDDLAFLVAVLVPRNRDLKIARIRESIRSDGTEVGQPELHAVVLTDIAAGVAVRKFDSEFQSTRNAGDLARSD